MTQKQALKLMLSGKNVFLTGAPGAGKTYVLDQFIKAAEAEGKEVAVTASTGIAASHVGGFTIHSWAGTGIKDNLTPEDVNFIAGNGRIAKRYKRADVLVIDEVSMLHDFRLDMVNLLAKKIRGSAAPFGGLQVILVGDLFQLPPVTRGMNHASPYGFVHLSNSWRELQLTICYLTEQHRQAEGDMLLDFLLRMRAGTVEKIHLNLLRARYVSEQNAPKDITRLYSHNVDVDAINNSELAKLPGKAKRFKMSWDGQPHQVEAMKRNILAPENLELKTGAQVMFVANNFNEGFVNGSQGTVTGFKKGSGLPIVKLAGGRSIVVERNSWKLKEMETTIAEVEQIPLRLAWAITIHKSQGMSMDAAEIDLSKAFTPGMGYVALSRVRSIDGLYLTGFNDMALAMHPEIYELDKLMLEAPYA